MKLTEHFTLEEMTQTSHKDLLATNIYYAMNQFSKLQYLTEFAEKVRDIIKSPMIISSAVRCPDLNYAVGGKSTSQHAKIEAIDFIPTKISLLEAFDKIRKSDLKFGQLIIEKSGEANWLHISVGDKCEVLKYNDGRYTVVP